MARNLIFQECADQIFTTKAAQKECFKSVVNNHGIMSIYFYNVFLGIYFLTANEFQTERNIEKTIVLFVMILSLGLNASIFGNVAVVISKMSVGLDPFIQDKVNIMKEYMNFMKFEAKFVGTIEVYHVNIWMKQRNDRY